MKCGVYKDKNYPQNYLARKKYGCSSWEEWQLVRKIRKEAYRIKRIEIYEACPTTKKVFRECLECSTPLEGRLRGTMFCSKRCAGRSYRKRFPDKIRERRKQYVKLHPKYRRLSRKKYRLRHPEKRPTYKGISKEAFGRMRAEYGFRCALCGKAELFLDQYWPFLTQDHWNPRHNGGKKNCNSKFF